MPNRMFSLLRITLLQLLETRQILLPKGVGHAHTRRVRVHGFERSHSAKNEVSPGRSPGCNAIDRGSLRVFGLLESLIQQFCPLRKIPVTAGTDPQYTD